MQYNIGYCIIIIIKHYLHEYIVLCADVIWYEALVNIQEWFKLYIWQCAWTLMGKCSHRVSDHMTGSVGFDSSWESRAEKRSVFNNTRIQNTRISTTVCVDLSRKTIALVSWNF